MTCGCRGRLRPCCRVPAVKHAALATVVAVDRPVAEADAWPVKLAAPRATVTTLMSKSAISKRRRRSLDTHPGPTVVVARVSPMFFPSVRVSMAAATSENLVAANPETASHKAAASRPKSWSDCQSALLLMSSLPGVEVLEGCCVTGHAPTV